MSGRRKGVRIKKTRSSGNVSTTTATKTPPPLQLGSIYESVVLNRGFDPLKERDARRSS